MIIVRVPLRISLGGGGTDLPGWYIKNGGFLITASINKYIYLSGSFRYFDKNYKNSFGILFDDVLAGIYTLIVVLLLLKFL